MISVYFKISLLLPQIVLGLLFSWKFGLMLVSQGFSTQHHNVYWIVIELFYANFLIWGGTCLVLLWGNSPSFLYICYINLMTHLTKYLINADILLTPNSWQSATSATQRKFWQYAIISVNIISTGNVIFLSYNIQQNSCVQDAKIGQQEKDILVLKQTAIESRKKFKELQQKHTSLLLKGQALKEEQ